MPPEVSTLPLFPSDWYMLQNDTVMCTAVKPRWQRELQR